MAKKGAQQGNTNATKNKPWQAALERALKKRSLKLQRDALDELAEKFLTLCDGGEISAFKELADRLDGKAAQPIEGTGEDKNIIVELVRFAN